MRFLLMLSALQNKKVSSHHCAPVVGSGDTKRERSKFIQQKMLASNPGKTLLCFFSRGKCSESARVMHYLTNVGLVRGVAEPNRDTNRSNNTGSETGWIRCFYTDRPGKKRYELSPPPPRGWLLQTYCPKIGPISLLKRFLRTVNMYSIQAARRCIQNVVVR